jgi:hypothetical protein
LRLNCVCERKESTTKQLQKFLLDFQRIFRHLKKKYFWDFSIKKISFIITYQLREGKKNHFLFLAVFSSFPILRSKFLHREVDGSFAEMKVCRVALSYCFLHSLLSEKMNEKYGI